MKQFGTVNVLLAGVVFLVTSAGAARGELCVESARPDPSNPLLAAQREAFQFHDEELVICSSGYQEAIHIAARLWVPRECQELSSGEGPVKGHCPGVLIAHGFGVNKEATFADMFSLVQKGFYVLSYDVRGQGVSGGQSNLMGREEVADQATVLRWFHENVSLTKVGVYRISQGGAHAYMAAIWEAYVTAKENLVVGPIYGGHYPEDDPTLKDSQRYESSEWDHETTSGTHQDLFKGFGNSYQSPNRVNGGKTFGCGAGATCAYSGTPGHSGAFATGWANAATLGFGGQSETFDQGGESAGEPTPPTPPPWQRCRYGRESSMKSIVLRKMKGASRLPHP